MADSVSRTGQSQGLLSSMVRAIFNRLGVRNEWMPNAR